MLARHPADADGRRGSRSTRTTSSCRSARACSTRSTSSSCPLSAPPPDTAVRSLLSTLTSIARERRTRGGPAAIWEDEGHPAIVVEQIDYQELLEREADEGPARRDVLWHSIVRSIIAGRRTFTEAEQQRLLEISRDAWAIGELADDCRSAYCGPDGSPLLTTQAATVMAVYRHIAATVGVLEPERAKEVMGNFALATSALEPALAMEVLRHAGSAGRSAARSWRRSSRRSTSSRSPCCWRARWRKPARRPTACRRCSTRMAPDDERAAPRAAARRQAAQRARLRQQAADHRHPQLARRAAAQVRRVTVRVRDVPRVDGPRHRARRRDGGARSAAGDRRVARRRSVTKACATCRDNC